jgi:hypothetical protein
MFMGASNYFSPIYSLTWKAQGIPRSHLWLFRLRLTARHTNEIAFGFWPTPTYSDNTERQLPKLDNLHITKNHTVRYVNDQGQQSFLRLHQVVKLWRTPTASAVNHRGNPQDPAVKKREATGRTIDLSMQVDGQLNPRWELELMGLPSDWLDIDSPPRVAWRNSHGKVRGLRRKLRSQTVMLRLRR